MKHLPHLWLALLLVIAPRVPAAETFSPDQLQLSAEARGVLAHECTKCHGQHKQKGGLRLDTKAAAFKGGEGGASIVVGKPAESELLRRVTLPTADDDHMPPEKGPLDARDVEILRKWIAAGAPWPEGETAGIVFQRAPIAPRKPAFPAGTEKFANPIDRFVAGYFAERQIAWPEPVDARTFLRRASMDVIGLPPKWEDVQRFDGNRAKAVDALLARNADYATHWLSFWNDALRNDYAGTGYIDGGRKQISAWLYAALERDVPYDQFVRELITGAAGSEGFVKGIKWRGNVSAGQRIELQAAQSIGQVFLGLNLKCVSCHDSFISDYKLTDAHRFAAIFADAPLEVFRCDKPTGEKTAAGFFWPELGEIDAGKSRAERQRDLANLLTDQKNGRLARVLVNRLWSACFGRGLIEPVDEMDRRAWNQDLLDWLAWDLAENGWKVKRTLQLLLTSRAYSLPAVAAPSADEIAKPSFVFRGPLVRRLSAEQFVDAVSTVTAPLYAKRDFAPGTDKAGVAGDAPWIWHAEGEKAKGLRYPVGTRYFRSSFEIPKGRRVKIARLVATADNTFTAYLDGRRIATGTEWNNAEAAEITQNVSGKTVVHLAVEANNTVAGAAGLRLALAIWFAGDPAPMIVQTGAQWRSSATAPKGWEKPAFDDTAWTPAVVLGPGGLPWGNVRGFALTEEPPLIRAALVQNDALQSALGRPIRDQITMSRPTQATLLQALTFANGRTFAGAIDRAGKSWTTKVPDPQQRLAALFRSTLLRDPRPEEKIFAQADPGDLLWSLLLQPEFQLIH